MWYLNGLALTCKGSNRRTANLVPCTRGKGKKSDTCVSRKISRSSPKVRLASSTIRRTNTPPLFVRDVSRMFCFCFHFSSTTGFTSVNNSGDRCDRFPLFSVQLPTSSMAGVGRQNIGFRRQLATVPRFIWR